MLNALIIQHSTCNIHYNMDFCKVLTILLSMLMMCSTVFKYSSYLNFTIWLLSNNINQYFVSLVSFDAIDILAMKSFLVWAALASATLAPILVAALNSCFDKTYSFCSMRILYNPIIQREKSKDSSRILFSVFITPHLTADSYRLNIQHNCSIVALIPLSVIASH